MIRNIRAYYRLINNLNSSIPLPDLHQVHIFNKIFDHWASKANPPIPVSIIKKYHLLYFFGGSRIQQLNELSAEYDPNILKFMENIPDLPNDLDSLSLSTWLALCEWVPEQKCMMYIALGQSEQAEQQLGYLCPLKRSKRINRITKDTIAILEKGYSDTPTDESAYQMPTDESAYQTPTDESAYQTPRSLATSSVGTEFEDLEPREQRAYCSVPDKPNPGPPLGGSRMGFMAWVGIVAVGIALGAYILKSFQPPSKKLNLEGLIARVSKPNELP